MPPARPLVLAALGCAVLLGATSALAQDQGPGRAELLDLFDDVVPQFAAEQVIRFKRRGDGLAIETDLKVAHGIRQVRLRGLAGVAQVQVGRRPRGPAGPVPFYEMEYRGPAGPTGGSVQTTVNASAGGVRVTRAHRLDNLHTTVRINQAALARRGGSEPRDNRVSFNVRVVTSANVVVDDLRLSAGSFDELLRRHAAPAAKYLAPVFRDFGQEAAVFGVDARVAWQLFPDAVEADEALASKVLSLVERLDGDDFRRRETATAELEALGGPAVLVLGELDREALTAEQNTRIDAFLAGYQRLDPAEVAALLDDPQFLLRCFTYCEVPPARAAAVRALERVLGRTPDLDPADDLPARARAADRVRDALPKPEQ